MSEVFRCSAASSDDGEPQTGTAPSDRAWLFVEYDGAWGRQALAESRLPEPVLAFLTGLAGVRVQLIRRHHRRSGPGTRVFAATADAWGARVGTALLTGPEELPGVDLTALVRGEGPALAAHHDPLWLVCTNGRRDVCCAERGRPIAEALSRRWPEATWETTHLGGHRFAGTLLALPSGLTLGRLGPGTALEACAAVQAGLWPAGLVRGRVGTRPAAQVAEQHLRDRRRLPGLRDVASLGADGEDELLLAGDGRWRVGVAPGTGPLRRQSCADASAKPAPVLTVTHCGPEPS